MILRILCIILFSETALLSVIFRILSFIGNWFIFKKCGQQSWKAVIPFYREYSKAQCADREMEGRILFFCNIIYILSLILTEVTPFDSSLNLFGILLGTMILLVNILYLVRVYLGLIENFQVSKWWIVPFIFVNWIPALIFGLLPKYQPQRKVPDIDSEGKNFFSSNVSVLESGLTVNLTERTAREFFKTKRLLKDIHLSIKPGSMVLLLGGSGAGKTTFLNAVIGYEKANAEITLDGSNIYQNYKNMMYEIGFVPQLDLMRGSDTVLSTLTDAAALRLPQNFSIEERRARVDEVMNIFGLTPVKGNLVDKLSGGQRKRLSISMEFLSNPTLFILDEPDSGLDGVMARELMQQLRMIADQGKIIIVITHTPDRVIDLFDDVIVLAKDEHRTGRLAFYGSIEDAKTFFERDSMEQIVKSINRKEEGGDGRADELIQKFMEVQNV